MHLLSLCPGAWNQHYLASLLWPWSPCSPEPLLHSKRRQGNEEPPLKIAPALHWENHLHSKEDAAEPKNKQIKRENKTGKRNVSNVQLRPLGAGLLSHAWILSRPGPKTGRVWGQGACGERASRRAPPWTCTACCPRNETTMSRSTQAQIQWNQISYAPKLLSPWGGRGLKSHLVSLSPKGGGPTTSQLPPSPDTTNNSTHREPREGGGVILGQEDKARSNETQDLRWVFWHFPL